jgi:hypothetical protein
VVERSVHIGKVAGPIPALPTRSDIGGPSARLTEPRAQCHTDTMEQFTSGPYQGFGKQHEVVPPGERRWKSKLQEAIERNQGMRPKTPPGKLLTDDEFRRYVSEVAENAFEFSKLRKQEPHAEAMDDAVEHLRLTLNYLRSIGREDIADEFQERLTGGVEDPDAAGRKAA